jgi:hypothetical protein
MKLKYLTLLVSFASLAIIGLIFLSCTNNVSYVPTFNQNVIATKQFSFSASEEGLYSSITGTIFVTGDVAKPKSLRAQIYAWVELDPNDLGGMVFFLQHSGWTFTSMTTDYPSNGENPKDHYFWSGGPQYSDTEIGLDKTFGGLLRSTGGKGIVVINLQPISSSIDILDPLDVNIEFGSLSNTQAYLSHQTISMRLSQLG